METNKLKDTLVDKKIKALVNVLDETLEVVERKTRCDTMGDVRAKALVKTLDDALKQLVETLANKPA